MHTLDLWDVLAINQSTYRIRKLAEDKTKESAEAIVSMAVMRRGVETEFYRAAKAGEYDDGDTYGNAPLTPPADVRD